MRRLLRRLVLCCRLLLIRRIRVCFLNRRTIRVRIIIVDIVLRCLTLLIRRRLLIVRRMRVIMVAFIRIIMARFPRLLPTCLLLP